MFDEKSKSKISAAKDYYYLLGVRPDATTEEIQEGYDELYDKFGPHVSVQGTDQDIMIKTYKDICDAYEILMDPAKRREYDKASSQTRQSGAELRALLSKKPTSPGNINAPSNFTTGTAHVQQQASATAPKAGITALAMELEIEVTLKEAVKGAKKEVKISDPKLCETCGNSRMSCPSCRGVGYFNVERVQEIDLPPGLFDGMELHLANIGRFDLRANCNGELIIKVKVKQHPVLGVLGRDITCTVPVTIYEAVLGSDIEVPSATGRIVMKIQPLTQPGRVYRLKGLGLAGADQLVQIDVQMPKTMTGEEASLYRKLKDLSQEPNPRESLFKQPG
jgi:DnaJ-class molecular chaperone